MEVHNFEELAQAYAQENLQICSGLTFLRGFSCEKSCHLHGKVCKATYGGELYEGKTRAEWIATFAAGKKLEKLFQEE
jgi:hypothetical protein